MVKVLKFSIKALICFCFFLSSFGHCLDLVDQIHTRRCTEFDSDRNETKLRPLTLKVSNVFVDPARLCFTHTLKVEEKKVAYKAMMGSIMVHDTSLTGLYTKKTFENAANKAKYERHCTAVNEVDHAIRQLWGKFNRRESHTFQDILNAMSSRSTPYKFKYENLLTRNFVDWFYETLEEHLPERNFFAGAATPQWFDNVSQFEHLEKP